MKTAIKPLLLFMAIVMASCNNKPIEDVEGFDYGKVENSQYTNKFFDIKINVPQGWSVQSQAENKQLMKDGAEMAAGGDKAMEKTLKAAEVNSANLLTVFKHDLNTQPAGEYNPNYVIVAENLSKIPGIKTGADYLAQNKKLMQASQMPFSFIDSNFKKRTINGIEFDEMKAVMDVQGAKIQQVYLATIKDKFALGVIYSYMTEAEKAELEKVISSLGNFKR